MSTRTAQGAIAWAISLNTVPTVAVPAYWMFGQSRFDGYELLRHREQFEKSETEQSVMRVMEEEGMLFEPATPHQRGQVKLLESLSMLPLTRFNEVDLLVNGEDTFDAILDSIEGADDYVLFQFYILRDDELGNRCKDALISKASEGVRVYVQFDGLGSHKLPEEFVEELKDAGVHVSTFKTTEGWTNPFRLNFRNHRKIVVVDGDEGFVGGHNVGDEYVGKHETLTPWRDTHVAFRGPVVLEAQVSFAEDWQWATGEILELEWDPEKSESGNIAAMCLPTGPADRFETGTLLMLDAINVAETRVWIASPYFVPDAQFISALQLAALRGVDVRIIVPENNDDQLVNLTSYSYLVETAEAGIKFYRYKPGFMHQKVMLIDDDSAMIGTANFDNRSMRLNFEVTMLMVDEGFAAKVKEMLEADLEECREVSPSEYTDSSFVFRFFVKTARLFAPVQ